MRPAVAVTLWMAPVEFLRAWTTILSGIVDGSRFTLTVEIVQASAVTLLGVGLVMTLASSIVLASAQFMVTNQRLMLKTDASKRRSFELSLHRVEAITKVSAISCIDATPAVEVGGSRIYRRRLGELVNYCVRAS